MFVEEGGGGEGVHIVKIVGTTVTDKLQSTDKSQQKYCTFKSKYDSHMLSVVDKKLSGTETYSHHRYISDGTELSVTNLFVTEKISLADKNICDTDIS